MRETSTARTGSFDLLRIVLIVMVCTLHACGRFDALFTAGSELSATKYAGMILESLSIVAVNTWVIMSGYLLVMKEFKLRRFLELLATVIFYAILGFLIVLLLAKTNTSVSSFFADELAGIFDGGIFAVVQLLFPISAEYYWFMTCYLLLYILTPVLNKGIRSLTKKQFEMILLLLLIWTSLIKSIVPVNFVTDNGGYDLKWFICLYLIGAYFRLAEIGYGQVSQDQTDKELSGVKKKPNRETFPKSISLYFGSVILIYVLSLFFYRVNASTGKLAYFMRVPLHYNFILTLTGACGLFLAFKNIKLGNEKTQRLFTQISAHTLGVYLLHAHPLLFYLWPLLTKQLLGVPPQNNGLVFVLYILLNVLFLFACGLLADLLRKVIFSFVEKAL